MPTLKVIKEIDNYFDTTDFQLMIKDAKLTDRHLKLIEQHQRSIKITHGLDASYVTYLTLLLSANSNFPAVKSFTSSKASSIFPSIPA